MVALTVMSVLFLGITDIVISGKRSSQVSHERLTAKNYADNLLESLRLKSCEELAPADSVKLDPGVLGLVYEPTADEAQLAASVKLERRMPTLFYVTLDIRNRKGVILASRQVVMTCE